MAKITKIEVQKRNKERVNIHIDGEYAFSASAELVYKERIKSDMEVDEIRLEEIISESNFLKCKETSLRIITRCYKTESEMKDRLTEKGYGSKEIERTIEFLKEYKFIDNRAYTEMYVKDRLRSQGIQKIKYALLRKGIEEEEIEEVLSNIDSEKEEEVGTEVAIKKYKQLIKKEEDIYKIKSKLGTFLVSKGYEYSLAKEIIRKVVNMDIGGEL